MSNRIIDSLIYNLLKLSVLVSLNVRELFLGCVVFRVVNERSEDTSIGHDDFFWENLVMPDLIFGVYFQFFSFAEWKVINALQLS